MNVCMYLRKSRADREAEQRGEGETLARHEKILFDTAKRMKLTVGAVYREIVSGDSIAARPEMQKLLSEVEAGIWDGVLVVEVERLARGDTIDQGIVSRSFQFTGTKIITPTKIYDPNNEFDQEYFEFGLFMSRREYKTIKRRLNAGRLASVNEGKFCGSVAPYGYRRVKLEKQKGFTLEPIPEQAATVCMIFEWYVNGDGETRIGTAKIANKLNSMGIKTLKGKAWIPGTVRDILENPVYAGKVRWNFRKTIKKVSGGMVSSTRPKQKEYIIIDGLHPAIVSEELYNMAQIIKAKNPPRPVNTRNPVKNPLAGLVVCSRCGRMMVRRPYPNRVPDLICPYTDCKNVASPLSQVETAVLQSLEGFINQYRLELSEAYIPAASDDKEQILASKQSELEKLYTQKNNMYDLLEQGIYSTELFLKRQKDVSNKISECETYISTIESEIAREQALADQRDNFIPKCEYVLGNYENLNISERNDLLKELILKIEYDKKCKNKKGHADDVTFTLNVYPKLL